MNTFSSDPHLELLIASTSLSKRLEQIAGQIDLDYQGEEITLLIIMKGALLVAADLMRKLRTPFRIELVEASSYGAGGAVRGELQTSSLSNRDFTGKHVLLIDDIFDTGHTMTRILEQVKGEKPQTTKTLALLLKNIPRSISYRPDYIGFEIENRFVVGYGLDYKELYRGLPGIYAFKGDIPPF